MVTSKYEREFRNFSDHPWPGKIIPNYFDNLEDAGDGKAGLQWINNRVHAAFYNKLVVEDVVYTSGATHMSGGYVFHTTGFLQVPTATLAACSGDQYVFVSGDGSGYVTSSAAKATGNVLVFMMETGAGAANETGHDLRFGSTNNKLNIWDIDVKNTFTAQNFRASGYVVATGNMESASYSGGQISGTSGLIERLQSTRINTTTFEYTNASGAQITGTSGSIGDLILDTISIGGGLLSLDEITGTSGLIPRLHSTRSTITTLEYGVASGAQITGTSGIINYALTDKIVNTNVITFGAEIGNGNASGTKTIDFDSGQKHLLTITGGTTITFNTPNNGVGNFLLKLVSGGAHTLAWAGEGAADILWSNGVETSWTSDGVDIIAIYYDGTDFYCQGSTNFS